MRQSTAELFLKLREKLGEDTAKVLTDYLEDVKEDLTSKFLTKDEAIQLFETLKAEIRANRREYIQMFKALKAEIKALDEKMDAKYSALEEKINAVEKEVKALEEKMDAKYSYLEGLIHSLEEKMDAKYSALEDRIKSVETEIKALDEKMNERYQRLEEKFDHKIDRTNLLLIFLIILTILGTTLFNPNFINIMKMLLGR